jgi:predicted AAA+ superfamily ATPase
LRRLFPRASYVLLEDPDVQGRARSDRRALLDELTPPVLFDEIQNVPELLGDVRTRIDQSPRRMGQWLFSGSQEAPLMQGVSESMAGRAAILHLVPPYFENFGKRLIKSSKMYLGNPGLACHLLGIRLWRKCKAAKTVQPAMAGPLLSLRRSMSRPPARLLLVHRRPEAAPSTHALSPGVAAACGTHIDGGGAAAC